MQPMQPMQQQPMQMQQRPQPQKKAMSGCIIAAIIVGALVLVGGVAVVGFVIFVVKKAGDMVGDMQAAVKDAQNAPGAAELRAAGCKEAMVLDLGKFAKQALKDIPGTGGMQIDAGGGVIVQCQVDSSTAMKCPAVAKTFLGASGHAVGPFTASVQESGGSEECSRDYDADGKDLGAASRHFNSKSGGTK